MSNNIELGHGSEQAPTELETESVEILEEKAEEIESELERIRLRIAAANLHTSVKEVMEYEAKRDMDRGEIREMEPVYGPEQAPTELETESVEILEKKTLEKRSELEEIRLRIAAANLHTSVEGVLEHRATEDRAREKIGKIRKKEAWGEVLFGSALAGGIIGGWEGAVIGGGLGLGVKSLIEVGKLVDKKFFPENKES